MGINYNPKTGMLDINARLEELAELYLDVPGLVGDVLLLEFMSWIMAAAMEQQSVVEMEYRGHLFRRAGDRVEVEKIEGGQDDEG